VAFTHLHVHTPYSLLDGMNRVERVPQLVKEMGQSALAITDHGSVAGAFAHVHSCRAAGIKPIVGMEAYYASNGRTTKEKDEDERNYYHLILLAQNNVGWKNLSILSSKAYSEGMYHKPRVDLELLADHSEGLMATTACLGSAFSRLILSNQRSQAERLIDEHLDVFKDRLFVELQPHRGEEQTSYNAALIDLARKRGLPLVITNDSHYTHTDHKYLHEQYLCIQSNSTMTNPKRFSFGDIDVHLCSEEWMTAQANTLGIPYEAIANTAYVADMVTDDYFADIVNVFPKFPFLEDGENAWDRLEYDAKVGLINRFKGKEVPLEYRERLNYELKVIKRLGFSDYILLVAWFIQTAKDKLDVYCGPGRGSAAGSLVCYALQITQMDPIFYGLLFERFLNAGRMASPVHFTKEQELFIASQQ